MLGNRNHLRPQPTEAPSGKHQVILHLCNPVLCDRVIAGRKAVQDASPLPKAMAAGKRSPNNPTQSKQAARKAR